MKMNVLLLLLALSVVGMEAAPTADVLEMKWIEFQLTHKKQYSSQTEKNFRKKIFLDNVRKIEEHNKDYENGLTSYSLGMNQFGDLLHREFINTTLMGVKRPENVTNTNFDTKIKANTFIPPANVDALPSYVDWSLVGAVTEVKNQGGCRSCWSFSATGAIEGQLFLKTNRLVSLSEQNLIDCTLEYGNYGCNGGWPDNAFKYVILNGIDSEVSYPYETKTKQCRYSTEKEVLSLSSFTDIRSGDEEQLKMAVATVGPITTIIDSTGFQFYKGGVFDYPNCKTSKGSGDHAVLIVGYGTSDDGLDYWIVKNSWGPWWGLNGYIFMSRNRANQCGIATECSFPLIA